MQRIDSRIILATVSIAFGLTVTIVTNCSPTYAQAPVTAAKLVHAGEGNASNVVVSFVPQNIEIKAGESITWDNPTSVAEPHSVTFLKDKKYFADFATPFQVVNSTEFQPSDPKSNAEPVFAPPQPGETTKTVVTINARAFLPVVLDSSGKKVTNLPPNSNYTMDGTESYVNSGWLWPEGQAPPDSPAISKFTVRFENPGTYPYLCNVHPWMIGSVIVK